MVDLNPSLGILEGESICDLTWFPSMNSQDPSTCCFLSSVRDHPVRLWDMVTGKVLNNELHIFKINLISSCHFFFLKILIYIYILTK